ncbi:MAG: archaellin/type IV pilin N-terminal domain-containing protein [Nitrososphaerota archaeon]
MVCSSFIMMVRSRSGISPVVATVILVAVAIVIAIAVAFWASGLVGIFTRFEKLEIVSAYQQDETTIVLSVKNTGTSPTSIIQVVVNGVEVHDLDKPAEFKVGESKRCILTFADDLIAGVTYEVALKTSGGKTYPTAILAHSGAGQPGAVPQIESFQCGEAGGGGGQTITETTPTTPATSGT